MGRSITERTLKQRKSILRYLADNPDASRGDVWGGARGLKKENGMRLTNLLAGLVRDGMVKRKGTRKTATYMLWTERPQQEPQKNSSEVTEEDVRTRTEVPDSWEDSIAIIVERINAMVDVNNLLGDKILELEAAITAFLNGTSTMADLSAVIE